MNPNLKWEKKIFNISFIGSLIFLVLEIIMAIITKSNAVTMDCVYDVADLILIGPFILLIPLLYKTETEKKPYGFSQVESLFIMIKSGVLIVITSLLVIDSIKLLLAGGNDVDASIIAIFELMVSFSCIIMYVILNKLSREHHASPSIKAELYIWKLDALSTMGVGVAFIIKLFIDNTIYAFISPYIDPIIAISLAGLLLKEPLGLFISSIKDLILFAPDSETSENIRKICEEVLEDKDCSINFLDIIRTGRKLWVEVYFVTKKDLISMSKLRIIHDEIDKKLKEEYDSLYIELIPDIDVVKDVSTVKMHKRPDKINHIKKVEKKKSSQSKKKVEKKKN